MRDFIPLGAGPADEEWADINQPEYRKRARASAQISTMFEEVRNERRDRRECRDGVCHD